MKYKERFINSDLSTTFSNPQTPKIMYQRKLPALTAPENDPHTADCQASISVPW